MAASEGPSKWLTFSITLAVATISASAAFSVYFWRRNPRDVNERVRELEVSLRSSLEKCASERQGRIRAQQALRKALTQPKSEKLELTSYPMAPIAIVRSCFSTRNGTPRQPLLVPLARASLLFDPARVPPASLEGLEEYSHCWIIYVFHLNTDLEKLWKHPSQSKFKAKVRVPRLKGGKKGVFATRSPHRPCPIGLTVAKVEAVQGHMVLISGVDLVDGTPVLDIKPYLPYCDSIQGATVPTWVKGDNLLSVVSVNFAEGFSTALTVCWTKLEKKSLYASLDEFQSLIKQVLSWDIRSVSQRSRPHNSLVKRENGLRVTDDTVDLDDYPDEAASENGSEGFSLPSSGETIYHLILEGLDVSYTMDSNGSVLVEKVTLSSNLPQYCKITAST
ncbi:uncharacterized protein LOC130784520 isoform X1 [Actinidia eriantha]|uniref:uncharacterized protein LOC130784520 isoform X1 n=1 Tax=Actinidia eriantha TaxID=165200 RepID=UPI00258EB6E1|nr:uncharacterized protein LOC130784520 isoform X1 [Actinidia eriantha]